jgi:uncharacterized lipoprotein YmbA
MSRRDRHVVLALWLTAALCGCASTSTPARFHSLVPPIADDAASTRAAPGLRVEVLPVTLPAQVDVPQLVVRLPDDSMRALEHERWIAPLADEIRAAIALRIDVVLSAAPAPAVASQPFRVALEVQRFDSTLGGAASLQALWSLQQPGSGAALRCLVNDRQAVADGPAALVAGHRALLERLGDAIGRALRAAAAGGVPACA